MGKRSNKVTSFEVRVGDINYGGHMGNDKALLLFHDARIKFLRGFGLDEDDIGEGAGIIMTEAHVYYLKEVFMYDRLYANIETGETGNVYFDLNYEICREADDVIVIKGSTRQLAYNYTQKKITRLPETLRSLLAVK